MSIQYMVLIPDSIVIPCCLLTSLLVRGIQIGEKWKQVGWWCFPGMSYVPTPCISCSCCWALPEGSDFISTLLVTFFEGMLGIFWCFATSLFYILSVFPEPYNKQSACFTNIISVTFTWDVTHTVHCLLWISLWFTSHNWVPECIPCFKYSREIILVPSGFNFTETSFT